MLRELDSVFSEAKYPGDVALADAYPNEWEATLKQLQGKHWRQAVAADFDSQGGILEGVQALGLKGFCFFLPGLLRLALIGQENRYLIVAALVTRFTYPDGPGDTNDTQQHIINELTLEQRIFLARFFEQSLKQEKMLCPVTIKSAIENLKSGQARPYKQRDIEAWVNKLSG